MSTPATTLLSSIFNLLPPPLYEQITGVPHFKNSSFCVYFTPTPHQYLDEILSFVQEKCDQEFQKLHWDQLSTLADNIIPIVFVDLAKVSSASAKSLLKMERGIFVLNNISAAAEPDFWGSVVTERSINGVTLSTDIIFMGIDDIDQRCHNTITKAGVVFTDKPYLH